MWLPVLESRQLGDAPKRVLYWGVPVVLYRTDTGKVAALEDMCGHRGIPLSQGSVRDGKIRCNFHHFRFDENGFCVKIPEVYDVDHEFRRRCSVRSFHVREEVGLVWISVEDEPSAPFPVERDNLPNDPVVVTRTFDVGGDIRVWMDHFLDVPHCIWTHAESTYSGSPERPARLAHSSIGINHDCDYPVRRAIEMTFEIDDDSPTATYALPMRMLTIVSRLRRSLRRIRGKPNKSPRLKVRADLVTPLCQETRSRIGRTNIAMWTSINPLERGKNQFVCSIVADGHGKNFLERKILRNLMSDFIYQHLGIEDANMLAQANYVEGERFRATDFDRTIQSMRTMFTRYVEEKSHLYPKGSLIHDLHYLPESTS
ncbi:hypothetical protein CEP50_09905 [Actinopolyspora mortivallis]|uniref:Rieske domain-containing protein n=2 Tax=Actinopolyspora mortivallis TaxID=33906 RepID=A0A2T0GWN4_ACTMO|nr:hypothetical protein CEP50_09905 [Actinopolyspora mortivallis]